MDINHPEVTTWFIASDETNTVYGEISPEQCMSTGMPDVVQFTDKEAWLAELANRGINPYEVDVPIDMGVA